MSKILVVNGYDDVDIGFVVGSILIFRWMRVLCRGTCCLDVSVSILICPGVLSSRGLRLGGCEDMPGLFLRR